ncbi:MAG: YchJ family protein [Polyangiales bacterium]
MKKRTKNVCPCGSGRAYGACCGPVHAGTEAKDAEALMRSRYSAFAKGDGAYLWRTLHSSHDDRTAKTSEAEWLERFAAGEAKHNRSYVGLRIIDTAPPDEQGVARVLFVARVKERGSVSSFAELSFFAEENGGWRYIAGILMDPVRATSIEELDDA